MLNSEKFLDAYGSIERYLRDRARGDKYRTFYQLVDQVAQSDSGVRRFEKDLKEFADLRNAIIHERGGGEVIAEPNDKALNAIKDIENVLLKPPILIPLFKAQVIELALNDPIGRAVKLMLEAEISQMPVKSGTQFIGLLTTNTVARWLGTCVLEDVFSLSETTVAQVLQYTEDEDNHVFLSRDSTIFEALEYFQHYESKGKRLEAVLITEHGKPPEQVLGIMTVTDLPKALQEINKSVS